MISATPYDSHAHRSSEPTTAKHIAYWTTTSLLVFCMTGGVFEILGLQPTVDGITRLGYPGYIIPALGLGKVLAVFAILWPGAARVKEWAYAGITFNMIGATVSHIACDDPTWSVVVCLSVLALSLTSWSLRPHSRKC